MSDWFMKKPCKNCPFRRDVKPYLRAARGEELSDAATNPYSSFPCHETTVSDDEFGGEGSEMVRVNTSKECAGFMTLQLIENGGDPEDGFEPAFDLVYSDAWEMRQAYEDAEQCR